MRLFILSLLAIGSVQSHSIGSTGRGYAYRSGLLAYSPARGEFPVQSSLAKGYLRYTDGSGTQRLESYWYPEPLNGVRQYITGAQPTQQQQFFQLDSTDVSKAHEEYFRAWCEQRYRDIQAEIERLRVTGIIPPQDIVEQLQPLQKILGATNVATAEVEQAREHQHLGSWNEARLRELHAHQSAQLRLSPSSVVLDTPEVVKAREEHFRLYNEAKLRAEQAPDYVEVKSANAATKQTAENTISNSSPNVQIELRQAEQQVAVAQETPAGVTALKSVSSSIQEHPLGLPFQQLAVGLRSVAGFDAPTEQQLRAVEETPEVKRAREEHLKLKKTQEEAIASRYNSEKGQQVVKTESVQKTLVEQENLNAQQPIQIEKSPTENVKQQSIGTLLANQFSRIEGTDEIKIAFAEYLKQVVEAKHNLTAQPGEVIDSVAAVGKILDKMIELENERQRELARLDAEENLRKEQSLHDSKLLLEDQRKMEGELLRLTQQEEQRKENERLAEEQRLKAEELLSLQRKETERLTEEQRLKKEEALIVEREESERLAEQQRLMEEEQLLKAAEKSAQIEVENQQNSAIVQQIRTDIQQSAAGQGSLAQNPYLVQITGRSGQGAANFLIAEQSPVQQNAATVRYYLPASTTGTHSQLYLNQVQPVAPSYTLENRPEWLKQQVETAKLILPQPQALVDERKFGSTKQVESTGEAINELEKATREHFRAHEIALEQLRLANLKDSQYTRCA